MVRRDDNRSLICLMKNIIRRAQKAYTKSICAVSRASTKCERTTNAELYTIFESGTQVMRKALDSNLTDCTFLYVYLPHFDFDCFPQTIVYLYKDIRRSICAYAHTYTHAYISKCKIVSHHFIIRMCERGYGTIS